MAGVCLSAAKRRALLASGILATMALAACSGIPLSSLPRLVQLSGQLLDTDPAQVMVAVQVDARLVPPAGSAPRLHLELKPKVAGAYEPVDKKLPLSVTAPSGAARGLATPPAGRRWLVYSMPPETQQELRRVQAMVRQAKAQPGGQGGGQLSMGIEQADLAVFEPALAKTKWSTWLQASQSEGFFEVWTGTAEELRQLGRDKR